MDNFSSRKIRRERIIKLAPACVLLLAGAAFIFSAFWGADNAPVKWRLYTGIAAAAAGAVYAAIVSLALRRPENTSIGREAARWSPNGRTGMLLGELDADLAKPVYTRGKIALGEKWLVFRGVPTKAVRLAQINALYLVETQKGQKQIHIFDADEAETILPAASADDARAIYDRLLIACPWVLRGEGAQGGKVYRSQNDKLERLLFIPVSHADEGELWALGFAAPLRAKNREDCNMLESPRSREQEQADLRSSAVSTEEGLRKMIEKMYRGMYCKHFDLLLTVMRQCPADQLEEFLCKHASLSEENAHKLAEFAQSTMAEYGRYGFSLPDTTVYAWDLAHAANLALCGYRAGYFHKGEALAYMNRAGEIANRHYHSWEEYAAAFLFGRHLGLHFSRDGAASQKLLDAELQRLNVLIRSPHSFYRAIRFDAGIGSDSRGRP